jgi:hypothetical protein
MTNEYKTLNTSKDNKELAIEQVQIHILIKLIYVLYSVYSRFEFFINSDKDAPRIKHEKNDNSRLFEELKNHLDGKVDNRRIGLLTTFLSLHLNLDIHINLISQIPKELFLEAINNELKLEKYHLSIKKIRTAIIEQSNKK